MAVVRRGVDSSLLAALSGGVFFPVVLVYLDWPGTPIRAHSNAGTITFGGNSYAGIGKFGQIGYPGEGVGMVAERVVLTILGEADVLMADAKASVRHREGAIYFGATTTRGGATLTGTPEEVFSGYMDALRFTVKREDGGVMYGLQLDLGSGPSARAVASVFHSYEDQIAKYPGDTAGRHLIEIEKRVQSVSQNR